MPDEELQPADASELTDAQINAMVREQIDAYRELPKTEMRVRPTWYRVIQFPRTVRKFERVFHAQGEPFTSRWWLALRMAAPTVRRKRKLDATSG